MSQAGETRPGRLITGTWVKSSRCSSGTCVEVQLLASQGLRLRDSKQNYLGVLQPIIDLSDTEFGAIKEAFSSHESRSTPADLEVESREDGGITITSARKSVSLNFDSSEVEAFRLGIQAGEFDT